MRFSTPRFRRHHRGRYRAPAAQAQVKLYGQAENRLHLLWHHDRWRLGGSQNAGRLRLRMPIDQRIPYVENVPEMSATVEQSIDLFLNHGDNIIIAGSYGYSDAFAAEAKAHPDVAFVNMAGISAAPNLESFYAKTYEGWYLAGMAAGYATKTKTLGMIEGFPIPDVLWDVNSFALGAPAANPGTVVKVAYVNAWSDPVKEAQISAAMIQQGADVIATDMDTDAALMVAEKAGKYSVGYQIDMAKSAPNGILTSVVFHWDKKLVPMVKAMAAAPGRAAARRFMASAPASLTTPLPAHPRRGHRQNRSRARRNIAGTFSPWTGPILSQDGKTWNPPATITEDDLWNMNYLVANVKGSMK